MRLKIITPLLADKKECKRRVRGYKQDARKDTEISVIGIQRGPTYVDYYYEHVWSAFAVMLEGEKAEKEKYAAVVPDCVFDPAVNALKGKLNIPVVAPFQVSIYIAATLGLKFSVLALDEKMARMLEEKVEEYGLTSRCASVRSMGIVYEKPFAGRSDEYIIQRALAAGKKAVEEDGADVLVLACTALFGARKKMRKKLGVPVIEPGVLAAKIAEVFVDLGLSQSKKAYPSASKKYEKNMPIKT